MRTDGSQTETVVGVVLAGGRSRRMGTDKARLEIDGRSLAERAARRLAAVCPRVVLADGGRQALDGARSVPDGPGAGPIAGILGAAAACSDAGLLVLACDLPYVPVSLLGELAARSGADWVVPRWSGRLEPLCALYRPRALAALGELAEAGVLAVHRLAESPGLEIDTVSGDRLRRHGEPAGVFTNLNEPDDVERLRRGTPADG